MRISALLLAPVAFLGLSVSAQAADITYNVIDGVLGTSGSFSGTFAISPTYMIDSGAFTVIAPSGGPTYTFTNITSNPVPGSAIFTDASSDMFRLNLNLASGSLGVNLLQVYGPAGDTALFPASGGRFDAYAAQVVQAASTSPVPEPSSLMLLGTGALGVATAFRRRILG